MSAARWPHLKELLNEALQRSGSERTAFLDDTCGDDAELRREVESLAAAHADAGGFLEAPVSLAVTGATRLIATLDTWATPAPVSAPRERFPLGTLINGRYRVEDIAGEGGMGSVYRVSDTALHRTLALKTIRGGPHFLNLFKIEFRTLAELTHPHLAQSYDFEPIAGSRDSCFTMEFVEGRNIFDVTDGAGWHGIVDSIVQLCRVLAYVHNRGLVHRDIKPTNVLVRDDGTIKLVDFGLVGTGSDAEYVMGTPAYLAPEIVRRETTDHRADLYSLGILLYQLLYRRLPFSGLAPSDVLYPHAHSSPRIPDRVDIPPWLGEVALRLSARLPSDRYRSANQVIEAINAAGSLHYPIETAVTRESYVLSGRFVGRQDELEKLSSFVADRLGERSAAGPFALVSGQSGIGKSRLVKELRHSLQLNDRTFIEGNCFEGAGSEYGAVGDAVRQLVPLVRSRGGEALVERGLAELATIVPELGRDREIAPRAPLVSAEAERLRLLDGVAAVLTDASRVFPYILHINDLQWAQRGTIDVLGHLQRRDAVEERRGLPLPLAVVVSYRSDETAGRPIEPWLDEMHERATVIQLDPLTRQPMRRLLESMFGLEEIPDAFVARVLDEADGSPFFLEEVVRALVENGSVFVEGGAWKTAIAVGDLEIPAGIVATVRRRLAMLVDPDQQQVMGVLAAYTKPMTVPLVARIAGLPLEAAQEALHDLTARNMVAAVGATGLYRTAHDHVRTTVYDDLGSRARGLHLQIATVLESSNDDLPLSELAHHYRLGEDRPKALKYALLAGESALSVYANDEAIEHLDHALMLLPSQWSDTRARAAEHLADANFLAGHYERAKALLLDVDGHAEALIDRTRLRRKLGEVVAYNEGTPGAAVDILWTAAQQLGAGRPPAGAAFFTRTVTALGRHFLQRAARPAIGIAARDPERMRLAELAGIYLRISQLSFFADPRLLFLPVFRAANLVDRLGESKERAQVYAMMGVALAGLGLRRRGLRYGEEAIAEAERVGTASHVANARGFHAVVLFESGRWQRALENAEAAREAFAACGDHFQLAISLYTILEVLHGRGDLKAGVVRAREELAVYERLGLQMIGKGVYTVFGQLLTKTGDSEGIAIGQEVLARAATGHDKLSTAWAHVALGDSLLQLGRLDEAIEHLERGLAIREQHRFDMYVVAPGDSLLARAYAAKWHVSRTAFTGAAARMFEQRVSRAVATGKRFPPMQSAAWLARGLLSRLRGQPRQAIRCFSESARLAGQLGARLWEAEAYLECGQTIAESNRRASADANAALHKALDLFRTCGAEPRRQTAVTALEQVRG
jgi:tetratricopeptide (TPR) repeat protein